MNAWRRGDILANIPEKYTQEAQDKRDRKRRLSGPKSRGNWGYGDIPSDRWPFKEKKGRGE
jgi:hypothetical protein